MTEPTTTYEWRIERLDAAPVEGELNDVVRRIHWRLQASDGINGAETYGDILLGSANPADFVAYPELTAETVIAWLEAAIDSRSSQDSRAPTVAQLRGSLAGVMEAQQAPVIVPLPLPWE